MCFHRLCFSQLIIPNDGINIGQSEQILVIKSNHIKREQKKNTQINDNKRNNNQVPQTIHLGCSIQKKDDDCASKISNHYQINNNFILNRKMDNEREEKKDREQKRGSKPKRKKMCTEKKKIAVWRLLNTS